MKLLTLSQADVNRLMDLDLLLDSLEAAMKELSRGEVEVPPRTQVTAEGGFLQTMLGYSPALGGVTKLVSVFPGNVERGLPSHQAVITLFDRRTNAPVVMMDGTRITAVRTAGVAALSARHLARQDSAILAIIGAGVQGGAHLELFPRVRQFREIRIASRTMASAQRLAELHPLARAVDGFEAAVRDADVVALCTHSGEPVVRSDWVAAGTHVSSVGFAPPDGELDRELARSGTLFVESRAASFRPPPIGCGELVGLDPNSAAELGEVLLGRRPGRRTPDEITVFKSMGHAVEDLAAANLVYRAAREAGVGRTLDL